jgi:hypothetical protein
VNPGAFGFPLGLADRLLAKMAESALADGVSMNALVLDDIDQSFRHLLLIAVLRSDGATTQETGLVRFNDDSGANYADNRFLVTNATNPAVDSGATSLNLFTTPGASSPAASFGAYAAFIADYSRSTRQKVMLLLGGHEKDTTLNNQWLFTAMGHWRVGDAIRKIEVRANSGNWTDGSYLSLYGLP